MRIRMPICLLDSLSCHLLDGSRHGLFNHVWFGGKPARPTSPHCSTLWPGCSTLWPGSSPVVCCCCCCCCCCSARANSIVKLNGPMFRGRTLARKSRACTEFSERCRSTCCRIGRASCTPGTASSIEAVEKFMLEVLHTHRSLCIEILPMLTSKTSISCSPKRQVMFCEPRPLL